MSQGKSRQGPRRASPRGDSEIPLEAASWPEPLGRLSLPLRGTWRGKWIAVGVFLLGVDATVVYYRLASPAYRAEAVVAERRPAVPSAVNPTLPSESPALSAWDLVHRRENLLALIGEANLLRPAGSSPARPGLLERLVRPFSEPGGDAGGSDDGGEALVRRLDRDLEVTTADGTITVAVEWPDPEQARRVVDVAVKRLLEARRLQPGDPLEEVLRPAQLPTSPIRPNPLTVFGLGTLASLALALLAARVASARSAPAAEREQAQGKGALRVLDGRGSTALAIQRGSRRDAFADREFQELWFVLARKHWKSLVLVPADEGESAAGTAASLAHVGRQLCQEPVTFLILADPIDTGSAARIITAFDSMMQAGTALANPAAGRVIVAVQPVVAEPLGIAVTKAADATVLCIRLGHTRLSAARRTIELVGRERIRGCLIVP